MNKFEDARSTGQKEENIMGKYEQDARQLLEYVGGKENIAAVSHCVSRMRFVLNDPAKADVAKIEALKSAKGTFTQAGQFQVIIGNTVNDFYNDFIAVSGIDGILSIQPAYMLSFALCMAIAIVVPFVLTVSVGKKKGIA